MGFRCLTTSAATPGQYNRDALAGFAAGGSLSQSSLMLKDKQRQDVQ